MNLDLTDEETAALLRELDGLIDGDRYLLSPRIQTLACFPRTRVGFFARRTRSAISARAWGGVVSSRRNSASRRCAT